MKTEGWRVGGGGEEKGGGRRSHSTDEILLVWLSGVVEEASIFLLLHFVIPASHPGAMAVKTHLAVPALSSK